MASSGTAHREPTPAVSTRVQAGRPSSAAGSSSTSHSSGGQSGPEPPGQDDDDSVEQDAEPDKGAPSRAGKGKERAVWVVPLDDLHDQSEPTATGQSTPANPSPLYNTKRPFDYSTDSHSSTDGGFPTPKKRKLTPSTAVDHAHAMLDTPMDDLSAMLNEVAPEAFMPPWMDSQIEGHMDDESRRPSFIEALGVEVAVDASQEGPLPAYESAGAALQWDQYEDRLFDAVFETFDDSEPGPSTGTHSRKGSGSSTKRVRFDDNVQIGSPPSVENSDEWSDMPTSYSNQPLFVPAPADLDGPSPTDNAFFWDAGARGTPNTPLSDRPHGQPHGDIDGELSGYDSDCGDTTDSDHTEPPPSHRAATPAPKALEPRQGAAPSSDARSRGPPFGIFTVKPSEGYIAIATPSRFVRPYLRSTGTAEGAKATASRTAEAYTHIVISPHAQRMIHALGPPSSYPATPISALSPALQTDVAPPVATRPPTADAVGSPAHRKSASPRVAAPVIPSDTISPPASDPPTLDDPNFDEIDTARDDAGFLFQQMVESKESGNVYARYQMRDGSEGEVSQTTRWRWSRGSASLDPDGPFGTSGSDYNLAACFPLPGENDEAEGVDDIDCTKFMNLSTDDDSANADGNGVPSAAAASAESTAPKPSTPKSSARKPAANSPQRRLQLNRGVDASVHFKLEQIGDRSHRAHGLDARAPAPQPLRSAKAADVLISPVRRRRDTEPLRAIY